MFATKKGNYVQVSENIAHALAGFDGGYRVRLHGLPEIEFAVEAPSIDRAQEMALQVARKEGKCTTNSGATIQAR